MLPEAVAGSLLAGRTCGVGPDLPINMVRDVVARAAGCGRYPLVGVDLTTDALLSDGSETDEVGALPESVPETSPAPASAALPSETADDLVEGTLETSPALPSAAPPPETGDDLAPALAAWTDALRSVERSINEAAESIRFLRATLQQMAPLLRSLGGLEEALGAFIDQPQRGPEAPPVAEFGAPLRLLDTEEEEPSRPASIPHGGEGGHLNREWQAMRRKSGAREKAHQAEEAEGGWVMPVGPSRPAPKPVTLVPDDTPAPYAYRVTVEDRKNSVELMQLHQALNSIPSVRNLSLLNYVNGIASISLESTDELQSSELENALHKVMKRNCTVVPHDSNTMLVQLGDKA